MPDPTQEAIDDRRKVMALEAKVAMLEAEWARAKGHGLGDILAVSGSMRFGGNIMRFDHLGQQIIAETGGGADIGVIYFVTQFVSAASDLDNTDTYAALQANLDAANNGSALLLFTNSGDYANPVGSQTFIESSSAGNVGTVQLTARGFGGLVEARLLVSANNTGTGQYVEVVPVLWLSTGHTSDPSIPGDGSAFYRSDTDKFRGRANGATDNFAMEAWVTAADAVHTGDAADAHDASAISILDAAGDFTATDVEAALAELAAHGNWKVFYSDGSGVFTELALGASGTVLQSNGASSAPTFAAAGGSSVIGSEVFRTTLDPTTWIVGNNTIASVSGGAVIIEKIEFRVTTTLQSGGAATLGIGDTGTANVYFAGATVANMTVGKFLRATPVVGSPVIVASQVPRVLNSVGSPNFIAAVGTAVFTAGAIEMVIVYTPLTSGATIA